VAYDGGGRRGAMVGWNSGVQEHLGGAGGELEAAEQLWQRGRFVDATQRLVGALELLPAHGDARAAVWTLLAECRLEMDQRGMARSACEQALNAADAPARSALGVRIRVGLAECLALDGDVEAARQTIEPLQHELDGYGDAVLRARGRALGLAMAAGRSRDPETPELTAALDALGRLGAHGSRWRITMGVGRMLELAGRPLDASAWFQAARSGDVADGWPAGVGPAAYAEAKVNIELRRLVDADVAAEVALSAARAQGDRAAMKTCLEMAIDLGVAVGAPQLTLNRLHEAADLAREDDDGRLRARLLARALKTVLIAGLPDAGATADALADVLAMLGPGALQPDDAFEVAQGLWDAGRGRAASDVMVRASQLAFGLGQPSSAAGCLAEAARMAQRSGEGELARDMWEEVVELAKTYGLDDRDVWEAEWRHRFPEP
jgi:tetratricopeptide (TPR) repeat protein